MAEADDEQLRTIMASGALTRAFLNAGMEVLPVLDARNLVNGQIDVTLPTSPGGTYRLTLERLPEKG